MNRAKTNGHLWLLLGHVGVTEYARTGPTSPM